MSEARRRTMVGISIRNVSKSFGNTLAVDHVSFEIQRGELFFLLGPSGCGKTTILRMIAGFGSRTKGTSSLASGESMTSRPTNAIPGWSSRAMLCGRT